MKGDGKRSLYSVLERSIGGVVGAGFSLQMILGFRGWNLRYIYIKEAAWLDKKQKKKYNVKNI